MLEVVNLVNQQRTANGLGTLAYDSSLSRIATHRSVEGADNNIFSHTRPDGSNFNVLFDIYGISSWVTCGENLAKGYTSASSAMEGWMNSQGHKDNILNNSFTSIGVGIARDSTGIYYWTQIFKG